MDRAPFAEQFDSLHAASRQATGYSDFGSHSYEAGLRVLLGALDSGPALNHAEYATAQGLIVSALSGRLHAQAGWTAWPHVLERKIVRPVIVIGLPRTGTTALHQLLSLDPQFQGLERWLLFNPMPRPPRETWESHPLYQGTARQIAELRRAAPKVAAAHSTEAWQLDECIAVMAQTFCSNLFASLLDVPDYDAWFRHQDETPAFRYHADVLKLVCNGDARTWLLKNPSHLMGVEAMLNVFPDACVVQTHRHPAQAIASMTSLVCGFRELWSGRRVDREAQERRETSLWAEAARRGMAAQDRHPGRFVNVLQADILRDPMDVVGRIYRQFGLHLSVEAEHGMREWIRANVPDSKLSHEYDLAQDNRAIAESFGPYIERFALDHSRAH